METNSWIQAMQSELNKQFSLLEKFTRLGMRLYLFGSAIQNECPHDLDIVILYHDRDMIEAQKIKMITIEYLESVFKIPIDCVLLSFKENEQVAFTSGENAKFIFPTK